ncbi:MAG: hypothetical protein JNK89_01510, partial [Saprospiraceae bacterium]|nr:hypothetical protein [Saprospiraceae bacterium]
MKTFSCLLGLGLLLFGQPRLAFAQVADTTGANCQDIIRLQNGSIFKGRIEEIRDEGRILMFRTWSGVLFDIHREQIRRITQRCKPGHMDYRFRERGWYHHTRGGALIGQADYTEHRVGAQLQHSSGWMFNRLLGAGLGTGVEFFDPPGNDAVNYPVFAEVQGFLLKKTVTPFYSAG